MVLQSLVRSCMACGPRMRGDVRGWRRLAMGAVLALAAAAGTLVAQAQPAQAMTVLQVDLKALVATADLVLYGPIAKTRVLDQRKTGHGVWTEFTLDVREVWKGDAKLAGKPFAWRHVGGTTADGITVAVPGMPTFTAGEEVIVVLEKTSESYVISGGPQGKFTVQARGNGTRIVRRDLPDVNFVRQDPATGRMESAGKPVSILRSLDEVRAEVQGYVAAAKKAATTTAPPAKGATVK